MPQTSSVLFGNTTVDNLTLTKKIWGNLFLIFLIITHRTTNKRREIRNLVGGGKWGIYNYKGQSDKEYSSSS